jgi:hypothetical protein
MSLRDAGTGAGKGVKDVGEQAKVKGKRDRGKINTGRRVYRAPLASRPFP